MAVDAEDAPVIATWWREADIIDYRLLRMRQGQWQRAATGLRNSDFPLGGHGTRRFPCARPAVLTGRDGSILLVLRDDLWDGRAALARFRWVPEGLQKEGFQLLTETSMGSWEPCCDPVLWQQEQQLEVLMLKSGARQDGAPATAEAAPLSSLRMSGWEEA